MAEARIGDATCKSKIVIHICDLTLRRPAGTVTRRVNDVFSGVQIGDFSVSPMADPARPDRVATDLGLDRLWNRTVTVLVIMAALTAAVAGAPASLVRNRRAGSVTAG